jgi:hypothetical protein
VEGTVATREQVAALAKPEGGVKALESLLVAHKGDWEDPERDPMDGIIQQVLSAESPSAVLTPYEALQAKDLIGVPFLLTDWTPRESEFDAGSPIYASIAAIMTDGSPQVINCGHKKVLAQLVKLKQFNEFPYKVMFITRGQSKQGTPMLELTTGPDEAFAEVPF